MINVCIDGDLETIIGGILEERRYQGHSDSELNELCVISNIFELGVLSYEAIMGRGSVRVSLATACKILWVRFRSYYLGVRG